MSKRPIGVIMLNTRFPRLPGDIGNPASFNRPVVYQAVASATVAAIVRRDGAAPAALDDLLAAAIRLEAAGAGVIATSCGFLGEAQERLARAVGVPVIASVLVMLPTIRALLADRPLGIMTFDARALAPRHFAGGYDPRDAVVGIENGSTLFDAIRRDRETFDPAGAEADAVKAAQRMIASRPDIAGVLLECTNLSPYRAALGRATGLPVFDLVQAIGWVADAVDARTATPMVDHSTAEPTI